MQVGARFQGINGFFDFRSGVGAAHALGVLDSGLRQDRASRVVVPVPGQAAALSLKRRAEVALRGTGLGYTIVRPGPLLEEPGGYKALVFDQVRPTCMGKPHLFVAPRAFLCTLLHRGCGSRRPSGPAESPQSTERSSVVMQPHRTCRTGAAAWKLMPNEEGDGHTEAVQNPMMLEERADAQQGSSGTNPNIIGVPVCRASASRRASAALTWRTSALRRCTTRPRATRPSRWVAKTSTALYDPHPGGK